MSTTTNSNSVPIAYDQYGLMMAAPADAAALYDRVVDRLLRYHPDVLPLATQLAEEHGNVAMTNAFIAYLNLSSATPPTCGTGRAARSRPSIPPIPTPAS